MANSYFKKVSGTSFAWDTVANWWTNAACTTAKGSLPAANDTIFIAGPMSTGPSVTRAFAMINVADATTGGWNFSAVFSGATGPATFNAGSYNTYGTVTGNATFNVGSYNSGSVTGNATFNASSYNRGSVGGTATFNAASINESNGGSVSGDATFNNSYSYGSVGGDATFNGSSNGGTVTGNATFNGTSYNQGTVNGTATFNNLTATAGVVVDTTGFANGIVGGLTQDSTGATITSWVFNSTFPELYSTITGNATFNGTAANISTVNGDATFNGTSYNAKGDDTGTGEGLVTGNATFNGTSYNQGTVTGNATFNNLTATAGVVVVTTGYSNGIVGGLTKDSTGATITGWVFNNVNGGSVTGNATFNGSSTLGYYSTVTGNATFNGTSYNQGNVTGNATFNDSSYNAGYGSTFYGTCTFNDSSICNAYASSMGGCVFNDSSSNTGHLPGGFAIQGGKIANTTGAVYDGEMTYAAYPTFYLVPATVDVLVSGLI